MDRRSFIEVLFASVFGAVAAVLGLRRGEPEAAKLVRFGKKYTPDEWAAACRGMTATEARARIEGYETNVERGPTLYVNPTQERLIDDWARDHSRAGDVVWQDDIVNEGRFTSSEELEAWLREHERAIEDIWLKHGKHSSFWVGKPAREIIGPVRWHSKDGIMERQPKKDLAKWLYDLKFENIYGNG